jgi:hypothetical protein
MPKFGVQHNSETTLVGGFPKMYCPPGVVTEFPDKASADAFVADFNGASTKFKAEVVEITDLEDE